MLPQISTPIERKKEIFRTCGCSNKSKYHKHGPVKTQRSRLSNLSVTMTVSSLKKLNEKPLQGSSNA